MNYNHSQYSLDRSQRFLIFSNLYISIQQLTQKVFLKKKHPDIFRCWSKDLTEFLLNYRGPMNMEWVYWWRLWCSVDRQDYHRIRTGSWLLCLDPCGIDWWLPFVNRWLGSELLDCSIATSIKYFTPATQSKFNKLPVWLYNEFIIIKIIIKILIWNQIRTSIFVLYFSMFFLTTESIILNHLYLNHDNYGNATIW